MVSDAVDRYQCAGQLQVKVQWGSVLRGGEMRVLLALLPTWHCLSSLLVQAMKPCVTTHDCVALYRNSDNTWTCRNSICVCVPDPCATMKPCVTTHDCVALYRNSDNTWTCRNSICVCVPDPCARVLMPGTIVMKQCWSDEDCDRNEFCSSRTNACACRSGYEYDHNRQCLNLEDHHSFFGPKFDPPRDMIVPGLFILGTITSIYFGFKLYCNDRWRIWRMRRRPLFRGRDMEAAVPPTTWVASYRVVEARTSPLYPPCLLLPMGPPPYEEALKHKVIMSSYHPQVHSDALPQVPL